MPKLKTKEEAYELCLSEGHIQHKEEINLEKIKSLIENAEINTNSSNLLAKAIDKSAKEWMNVYTLCYDALGIYAEALLLFEKIESNNHQCLFAALCLKYAHLELEWDFFESLRTKRNGINYYGERINHHDWRSIEMQMKLYLSTLKEEVKRKLS